MESAPPQGGSWVGLAVYEHILPIVFIKVSRINICRDVSP